MTKSDKEWAEDARNAADSYLASLKKPNVTDDEQRTEEEEMVVWMDLNKPGTFWVGTEEGMKDMYEEHGGHPSRVKNETVLQAVKEGKTEVLYKCLDTLECFWGIRKYTIF